MHRIFFGFIVFVVLSNAYAQSLFDETTYKPLAVDMRSFKKGQILTVLIYESATASSSTDTNTGKSLGFGAQADDGNNQKSGNIAINNDFDGGGTLTRSGKFIASVSVSIEDINESGELIIKGEQHLEFNNEMQHISLSGKVRAEDVGSDNTVISTRIADADIKYLGDGLLSERERPGILTKFFNWLF